jgi:hypothetical protein
VSIFPFTSLANDIDIRDPGWAFLVDVAGGRGQILVVIKSDIEAIGKGEVAKWILREKMAVIDSIPDN